jgi:hypothetical protein
LPEFPRQSGAARHRAFEFETVEERFKSTYFAIINSMVKEIKSRVQKCRNRLLKINCLNNKRKGKASKKELEDRSLEYELRRVCEIRWGKQGCLRLQ